MNQPDPVNRIELLKKVQFDPSIDTCPDAEVSDESLREAMQHASRKSPDQKQRATDRLDSLLQSNQLEHFESRFEWPSEFREDDEALTLPVRLEDFCQITPIRRGRHAYACRAFDEKLGRDVALKIPRINSDGTAFDLSLEIDALRRHDDERIVRLIQVVSTPEGEVPVMEFIDGWSLREVIARTTLSIDEMAAVGYEIARGLEALSRSKSVHRDIKPDNIMLARRGALKIVDLGTVLPLQSVPPNTSSQPRFVCGTIGYMAPEQEQDSNRVDCTADYFSFGITLLELLTGKRPADRGVDGEPFTDEQWNASVQEAFPKSLPTDLKDVLLKLTSRYRKQRQASLSDALPVLKKHAGQVDLVELAGRLAKDEEKANPSITSTPPSSIQQKLDQNTQSQKARRWALLGIPILILPFIGYMLFPGKMHRAAPNDATINAIRGVWVADSVKGKDGAPADSLQIGIEDQRFFLLDRGSPVFVGSYLVSDYQERDGAIEMTWDIKPKATVSKARFQGKFQIRDERLTATFTQTHDSDAKPIVADQTPENRLIFSSSKRHQWPLGTKTVRELMHLGENDESAERVEIVSAQLERSRVDFQKAGNFRNRNAELGIIPPAPFNVIGR